MNRRDRFATPKQVRRHIERVLPDEARRAMCLSIFADSIDRLHAHGPDKWGVYCKDSHVRLRGGGLIVLTIERNEIWLALDQEAIDASAPMPNKLNSAQGIRYDRGRWAHYKRPPTTNIFYSPTAENTRDWQPIRSLHFALLDRVAREAFRVDSQKKHQPSVSAYLQMVLHRWVPEPAYSSRLNPVDNATSSAARKYQPTCFDTKQRTIMRLANTVRDTVAGAHGQQALRTVKNKEFRFGSSHDLESYIDALISRDFLGMVNFGSLVFSGVYNSLNLLENREYPARSKWMC
jgi:hypothetical protein